MSDTGLAPAYSYSLSRGLFAGVSFDGSVLFARSDLNYNFYGRQVSPQQLLCGAVPNPRAAEPLYTALSEALAQVPDVSHSRRSQSQQAYAKMPAYSEPIAEDPFSSKSADS